MAAASALRSGMRPGRPLLRRPAAPPSPALRRPRNGPASPSARFSTAPVRPAKNQIFSPIRSPDSFSTHLAVSSSSRVPLLTLWTASWAPICQTTILPLLVHLVTSGVGESHGGVSLAEVEMDAPDLAGSATSSHDHLALTYAINTVPTLLSFDAGEAQVTTKVTDVRELADRRFLEQWIVNEAKRHGSRGGGGGTGMGGMGAMFGGLFGRHHQ